MAVFSLRINIISFLHKIFRDSTSQNTLSKMFESVCKDTRSWLRRALPKRLLKATSIIGLAFQEELKVCTVKSYIIIKFCHDV